MLEDAICVGQRSSVRRHTVGIPTNMSPKPDFTPDSSGPYLRPRLIPKRPSDGDGDAAAGPAHDDNAKSQQSNIHQAAPQATEWFRDTAVVPDAFRDLLLEYSHIPPAEVDEHVVRIVSIDRVSFQ